MSTNKSPITHPVPLPPLPSLSSNPIFAPKEPEPASSITQAGANNAVGASRAAQVVSPPLSTHGLGARTISPTGASERERNVSGIESRLEGDDAREGNVTASRSHASAAVTEWEMAYERGQEESWAQKVRDDLRGWRGGHGVKRSVYSRQALPEQSYFHQPATGDVSQHLPKEIIRVERDWSDGEVCQFETSFPMELEDRISPAQFTAFINTLNEHLVAAYSVRGAVVDNLIAIATWWTSLLWRVSTFEREMRKVEEEIQRANEKFFNPAGLNVLTPRDVALQFLEIEYY